MRLLADTHILIWWLEGGESLARTHRDALGDTANDVFFSAVSIAEISIKASLGKLDVPTTAAADLTAAGMLHLALEAQHADALRDLPMHHRDPFDRMLVAQARVEGLTVVTRDRRFAAYGVPLL